MIEPAAPALPASLRGDEPILLVMDVDSTLIQDEVIELLAEHAGTREQVAAVTESAMRGEIDFPQILHARVATLAGVEVEALAQVRAAARLTPGARELVGTLQERAHVVGLVSGGFIEVVGALAADLGITEARANALEVADGRLTGRVHGEVVDRAAKARFLREVAQRHRIPAGRTVAVGDGANDLDMMDAAALGVAFCAKPAVRQAADVSITEPRLDAVLDVLGLR